MALRDVNVAAAAESIGGAADEILPGAGKVGSLVGGVLSAFGLGGNGSEPPVDQLPSVVLVQPVIPGILDLEGQGPLLSRTAVLFGRLRLPVPVAAGLAIFAWRSRRKLLSMAKGRRGKTVLLALGALALASRVRSVT